jgi:hypothetical protein
MARYRMGDAAAILAEGVNDRHVAAIAQSD